MAPVLHVEAMERLRLAPAELGLLANFWPTHPIVVLAAAGAGVAAITMAKAAGSLLKIAKKSLDLFLAALNYLKKFLPISTFEELLSYLKRNLSAGAVSARAGIEQLSQSIVRTKKGTEVELPVVRPLKPRSGPQLDTLNLPSGVRQSEVDAIFGYSLGEYQDYNTILRGYEGAPSSFGPRMQQQYDLVVSGLRKLPEHSGPTYRGADLSPDQLLKYKQAFQGGERISDSGFISTTQSSSRLNNYINTDPSKIPVKMEVRGRSGRDISSISNYPQEQEVLFMPGTKFKVIEYTETPDGVSLILEEIID